MCVHRTEDGKCLKHSGNNVLSFCVDGPCPDETPTNGDQVRAMTDEEIEKFLHEVYGRGMESVIFGESGEPVKGFTWTEDWLQQPAKED